MQRLRAEGVNTPADILLTEDAGNLAGRAIGFIAAGQFQGITRQHSRLFARPEQSVVWPVGARPHLGLQHEKNPARPASTYEDLANPKWQGRLCLRTAKKVYNQSLVAMMIAEHGETKTEQIVLGWVANLATDVFPDDTKMLEAIAAGQCDVGIVNTYYFGRLIEKNPKLPLALFWPNQSANGVHVNVSGAGLTKYAKHPAAATKLLEWLSFKQAQNLSPT